MQVKAIFDFILATIGLTILLPIFCIVAIWIKFDSRGPVLFRQVRVGKDGKPFNIFKFRSMRVGSEFGGMLTVGDCDSRITNSGRFIRKYKIDELPQLINVLSGDMSLVGPRPEVPEYMDVYTPEIKSKVLSVKPGITDNASIMMVDENQILASYSDPKDAYVTVVLPIKQKFYLDYVDNQSFWGDLKIIARTIIKIVSR